MQEMVIVLIGSAGMLPVNAGGCGHALPMVSRERKDE